MITKKLLFLLLNIITIFVVANVNAQSPTKTEIKQSVMKIVELVQENYVLPEKGQEIANYFLKDYKNGRFSSAQSWKQLDSITTKSLREVSNDGHLYSWHNLKIVKELQQEKTHKNKDNPNEETSSFFNNKEAYSNNFGFQKTEVLKGNIGYIKLSQINISEHSLKTLIASMQIIKHTKALIIDLRNNGGGGSTIGSVLESFFFEKPTDLLEFKSKGGNIETEQTVTWLLEDRYTQPVYILINKKTGSAAEAFAFALKHQKRAIIIGEPSAGAAFMNTYFLVNKNIILSVSTSAPFLPGSTISWEKKGVQPDISTNSENAKEKVVKLIQERFKDEH